MRFQALLLIATLCSSVYSQLTGPISLKVGTETQIDFAIGLSTNECGVQRGTGSGVDVNNPVFLLSSGAGAGVCVPKTLNLVGSYLWGVFLSNLHQLITDRTSRSGTASTTEYPTLRTPTAGTVYVLRLDAAPNTANKFGKITKGYMIGTKTAAGTWGKINDVTAATSCRHYLILTVTTDSDKFLTNEQGVTSTIAGNGVFLAINTRTGQWTPYASTTTNLCDQLKAIPEKEEVKKNSASILSIAALAALGVVAI